MDILTYRKEQGLSQSAFAGLLTESGSPATQGLISQWEKGAVLVPPERWGVIEQITAGKVSRYDLRPDVFGPAPANDEPTTQPEAAHG